MPGSATRLSNQIQAPRSRVYRALIDPVAIAIWMVPDDMTSHVHFCEAREGGSFRISLSYDAPTTMGKTSAQTDTYHGHFVRLVPDKEVVEVMEFETADESMRGEMTVTFTLTDSQGGTRVDAVHDHLPSGLSAADNELGWRMSLEKLKSLVETGNDH